MLNKLLLTALSGAACVLGWAPYNLPWVAVGSYAVLFVVLLQSRTIGHAALFGGVYAVALHAMGSTWVFEAMLHRANAGFFFAILGTGIFVLYLALFTIFGATLFCWILRPPGTPSDAFKTTYLLLAVVVFSVILTLSEFARSLFFNGYTPLSLGYAFVNGDARAFIPLGGVYLASFVGYLWAGLLACGFLHITSGQWLRPVLPYALVASALWCAALGLNHYDWVKPYGAPLTFRLIQGNIKQDDKFKPEKLQEQINQYAEIITAHRADLIVTPETALPVLLNELPSDVLERLKNFSTASGSHIFLGVATLSSLGKGHNSVLQLAPNSAQQAQYDKIRLMPFGEYSPYGFGWFSSRLHIAFKDLMPGVTPPKPFSLQTNQPNWSYLVGTLICHEDMLGNDLKQWLPNAHILLNPSNLSWFDGTIALQQRAQMAQARALEAGRPILRVANTGVSAHIDHLGRIQQYAAEGQQVVVTGSVHAMQDATPFAKYNNNLLVMIFILTLVICTVAVRKFVVSQPHTRNVTKGF
jgi:apolipoprotein N-acyltransferase